MRNLCISATASNQGKTILTTALLYYYRESVRAFKIGPDFIDPQFHKRVSCSDSINLDSFIMNERGVEWIYHHYSDKDISIVEGVMGFYDGEDRGCSTYSISRVLDIPTILVMDGGGSYITISAILKGLREYRCDSTIKGVVLNKISSQNHYRLIADQICRDHDDIVMLGWIEKNLPSLRDTHLGLDLRDISKIEDISRDVLKHIDMAKVWSLSDDISPLKIPYPFPKVPHIERKLAIVHDENFSFLYYDNLKFLSEVFREVVIVDSTKDEVIPKDCDSIYICGGYVESSEAYERVRDSSRFRASLVDMSRSCKIYAECAGLLYLSNRVDEKSMSGILDIEFTLGSRWSRLGYYYSEDGVKGHAFHYTYPTQESLSKAYNILSKSQNGRGVEGSWRSGDIYGTYLHTMLRCYPEVLRFL